ncbi:hypothetical protein ACFORJ_07025 [Corynebacterium hansenii]|uniref:Uncharacterized protein n=1 Tax=Corynebacterium hansenii TaxID=394964 RepID=A0ABV7ZRA5_9CORY|nr:hypothetical protein [Corynebacterium hansenii]WJZ00499.1 hypothetical protein CHAN_09475 [Corynebacterium hansenii]
MTAPNTPADDATQHDPQADEHTHPTDAGRPDDEQHTDDRPDEQTPTDERIKQARAEAARYRTRLREAEAARDEVTAKYEALLRGTIEAEAQLKHHTPGIALWDAGTNPTDLLNDTGHLDPGKLRDACNNVRDRYGIGRLPESPAQGTHTTTPAAVTWRDALQGQ